MARCNSCSKFVPYGDPRTDEIEVDVDDDGQVNLHGTLYLTCEECGDDLKMADMEADEDATAAFSEDEEIPEDAEVSYEVVGDPAVEATDRHQDTDRKGKKIKKSRYMKRFFGVSVQVDIKRTIAVEGKDPVEETASVTLEAEEQASGFEDC